LEVVEENVTVVEALHVDRSRIIREAVYVRFFRQFLAERGEVNVVVEGEALKRPGVHEADAFRLLADDERLEKRLPGALISDDASPAHAYSERELSSIVTAMRQITRTACQPNQ